MLLHGSHYDFLAMISKLLRQMSETFLSQISNLHRCKLEYYDRVSQQLHYHNSGLFLKKKKKFLNNFNNFWIFYQKIKCLQVWRRDEADIHQSRVSMSARNEVRIIPVAVVVVLLEFLDSLMIDFLLNSCPYQYFQLAFKFLIINSWVQLIVPFKKLIQPSTKISRKF